MPLAPIYTNFQGDFWPFFFKNLLAAQIFFLSKQGFIVFWERPEYQFGRPKIIFFWNSAPLEKILDPPLESALILFSSSCSTSIPDERMNLILSVGFFLLESEVTFVLFDRSVCLGFSILFFFFQKFYLLKIFFNFVVSEFWWEKFSVLCMGNQ